MTGAVHRQRGPTRDRPSPNDIFTENVVYSLDTRDLQFHGPLLETRNSPERPIQTIGTVVSSFPGNDLEMFMNLCCFLFGKSEFPSADRRLMHFHRLDDERAG
jgi:hypothetical protein